MFEKELKSQTENVLRFENDVIVLKKLRFNQYFKANFEIVPDYRVRLGLLKLVTRTFKQAAAQRARATATQR